MLRGSSKQLKDIAVFILNEQYRPSYGYVWYQDHYVGHDSSVSIATGYGLDGPGIESRWGEARFSASVQTGLLGPTQPPIQWVPGLSQG